MEGWNEGVITFSPTYKYLPNSDEYCWHAHGRNGERRRAPAWLVESTSTGERKKRILFTDAGDMKSAGFAGAIEYYGLVKD